MKIIKTMDMYFFLKFLKSLRDSEKTIIVLLSRSYQGLEGLKESKKVHFTHFYKKIKSCHENYKKPWICTFF
jgi:hypothetical protein